MQSRGRSTLTKSQEIQQQHVNVNRFTAASSGHPLQSVTAPTFPINQSFPSFAPPAMGGAGFGFPGMSPSVSMTPSMGGRLGGVEGSSSGYPLMGSAGVSRTPAGGNGGLSKLIKGLEKEDSQSKQAKDSQMVTIRRVMDPVSAEPTVTITLKGEEANQEKVLYKLVNGQGEPWAWIG